MQEQAYGGASVVAFLRQLPRPIRGTLLVIWDGATIHHCHEVTHYLAAGAAARLHLERLPGCAPDLTPDEGVWHHLKRTELAHRRCQDMPDLRWELDLAPRRWRRRRHVLIACFRQCGYV